MKKEQMKSSARFLLFTCLVCLASMFTSAQTNKAYGDNMKQVDSVLVGSVYQPVFAIYSGDIDDGSQTFTQDGTVDISDFLMYDADAQSGSAFGYLNTDLNGDGTTDISDFLIYDANAQLGATIIRPY